VIDYGVGDVVVCVIPHDVRHVFCPACGTEGPKIEKGTFHRVRTMDTSYRSEACLDSGVGVQVEGVGCDYWYFCAYTFKKPGKKMDIFKLAEPRKVDTPAKELVPVDLYGALQESWDV